METKEIEFKVGDICVLKDSDGINPEGFIFMIENISLTGNLLYKQRSYGSYTLLGCEPSKARLANLEDFEN